MRTFDLVRRFMMLGVIIPALPNNIIDGQAIDAVPLMADLNAIVAAVNTNAAAQSQVSAIQSTVNALGLRANFTPGIAFGGGSTGLTYISQIGYQFPLQSAVLVCGVVQINAKGSSTGTATLTGLPTSANISWGAFSNAGFPLMCALTAITIPGSAGANSPALILPPNSSIANIMGMNSGVGMSFYNNADFAVGSAVSFMGIYPTS